MAKARTVDQSSDFLARLQQKSKTEVAETQRIQRGDEIYNRYTEGRHMRYIDHGKLVAAPDDWNRFPRLKEKNPAKYAELLLSISTNGIWQPLIVWEQKSGSYMILAGHNRWEANEEILEGCVPDSEEANKFKKIPCVVYPYDELSETKAREIIIDTNYIQRRDNVKETAWIIKNRMDLLKTQKTPKGENIKEICQALGIRHSNVYENLAIVERVIEPIQELFYNGNITKKAVVKVSVLDMDLQEWMYEEYGSQITSKVLMKITQSITTRDQIRELFAYEDEPDIRKIQIKIPQSKIKEIRPLLDEFQSIIVDLDEAQRRELSEFLEKIKKNQ